MIGQELNSAAPPPDPTMMSSSQDGGTHILDILASLFYRGRKWRCGSHVDAMYDSGL